MDLAVDKVKFDDEDILRKVSLWSAEFKRLKSSLILIDKLYCQKVLAVQSIENRDAKIDSINKALTDYVGEISNLSQTVMERDRQIVELNEAINARDGIISDLNRQICGHKEAIVQQDEQISILNQTISSLGSQIQEIYASSSWRITHPLRVMKSLFVGKKDVVIRNKRG